MLHMSAVLRLFLRTPSHRLIYGLMAVSFTLIWFGMPNAEKAVTSFPVSALAMALASAACLVAAIKPESAGIWLVSYWAVLGAVGWRITALVIVEVRDGPVYGRERLIFTLVGGYATVAVLAAAAWTAVLRPGGNGEA